MKLVHLVHHYEGTEKDGNKVGFEDERTDACLKTMKYLKDNERDDLYRKYVSILAEHHLQVGHISVLFS